MRFLGLQAAEDADIFERARAADDIVIVSKDSDFIELILRRGVPPFFIWVTCGNLTNRRLREVFSQVFEQAMGLLMAGESIVEIGDARPIRKTLAARAGSTCDYLSAPAGRGGQGGGS